MNSLDQQVLDSLCAWLEEGQQSWLCTIIATFGSSPRPVGSLLACCEDGRYEGSLSGGCVEDDLRESIFAGKLATSTPERIKYGVAVEDVMRLGLPCGGTLEVVVEPIRQEQLSLYHKLRELISRRQPVCRQVNLASGAMSIEEVEAFTPLEVSDNHLRHTYAPEFQLLLIGAVQVAWYLAEMAQALDFRVEICDPRADLIDNFHKRDIPLENSMPDDWLREKTIDNHTAIVALCHDPRIDDMALLEALNHNAFYIGAMGSSRTSELRRKRLLELGITETQLAKLHAPVGLDIGSKTPPEIAIAILAQLTQLRTAKGR